MGKDYSILNLNIVPGDFYRGPFKDIYSLKREAKRIEASEPFFGNFLLMASGKLKRGYDRNLVQDTVELDMDSHDANHIHWGSKGVTYLEKKGRNVVLEDYPIPQEFRSSPYYTLEGVVGKEKNTDRKIKLIKGEMINHSLEDEAKHLDNSIAKREKTKLKLFENAYKNYID